MRTGVDGAHARAVVGVRHVAKHAHRAAWRNFRQRSFLPACTTRGAAARRRARFDTPLTSAQRSTGATARTPGLTTARRNGANVDSPSMSYAHGGSRSMPACITSVAAGRIAGPATGAFIRMRTTSNVRGPASSWGCMRAR